MWNWACSHPLSDEVDAEFAAVMTPTDDTYGNSNGGDVGREVQVGVYAAGWATLASHPIDSQRRKMQEEADA